VLVFPSLTDTFGLAVIEALACGVPVAAFPVPGPLAGLAPIPLALRATLAVSRSSVIIARIAARRQTSEAGDAN